MKCDEARPICARCSKVGRTCEQDERPSQPTRPNNTRFRSVVFAEPSRAVIVEGDSQVSLDYFHCYTLPLLVQSEPSLLWQCMLRDVSSDQNLLHVAAALGFEHMNIVHRPAPNASQTSCRLYARALTSLRKAISPVSPTQLSNAAVRCLLMVILQSLRRQLPDMLVHLRCGFRIASRDILHGNPPELREARRIMTRYCVFSKLFNSFGADTDHTMDITHDSDAHVQDIRTSELHEDQILMAETDILVHNVLGAMRRLRKPESDGNGHITMEIPNVQDASFDDMILHLNTKQQTLESAIHSQIQDTGTPVSSLLASTLALCILVRVFLHYCSHHSQAAFDSQLPAFRQIIDLEKIVLASLDNSRSVASTPPFSLGLGAITILAYIASLCRDRELRREALDTLKLCPLIEGPWTVQSAGSICATLITYEERLASASRGNDFAMTAYIPEHCRVYYCSLCPISRDGIRYVRFFRRAGGNTTSFTHEDVPLLEEIDSGI